MPVVIYEGPSLTNLTPLVFLRPSFQLRIGTGTILNNYMRFFRGKPGFLTRRIFGEAKLRLGFGPVLFLDGQFFLNEGLALAGPDELFVCDGEVVGFRKTKPPYPVTLEDAPRIAKKFKVRRRLKGRFLRYLWDFVEYNPIAIAQAFTSSTCQGRCEKGVVVEGPSRRLLVKRSARVGPLVYVDVRSGPVIIDEMARVLPFSRIIGPCYVGPKTIIDGARIGPGCSFGPDCRVSGEVEASIFQGRTNKHHEGFLGHSFIGEWVNLGAGTTNSDLKNNYGPVRVMLGKHEVDSGLIKVGCFIGDHTKTGIGTLLPTGASIGAFVNLFGGGMMPRAVASFKWGTGQKLVAYRVADALKTARTVAQRRGTRLTATEEDLIRKLYAELDRR